MDYIHDMEIGGQAVKIEQEDADVIVKAALENWDVQQAAGRKADDVAEDILRGASGDKLMHIPATATFLAGLSGLLEWYGNRTAESAIAGNIDGPAEQVLKALRQDRYALGERALELSGRVEMAKLGLGGIALLDRPDDAFLQALIPRQADPLEP